ncbi:MAG: DUF305 domain-containing protein [Rhodobacteraceae bacterium]|nr:DUF305 domain-containing protein [Paracoccaceae bacterium]
MTDDSASAKQAPAELIHQGEYSDLRWVEMMAAHHAMAVEMAQVALDRASHDTLKDFARDVIESQRDEIETLSKIRDDLDGKGKIPTKPHPGERSMFGMLSVDELKKVKDFDRAFIDSQLPHHASAIEMAAVSLHQTSRDDIAKLSRQIIDAQCEEVGKMIGWRHEWFGKKG